MNVLYIALPIALLISLLAVVAFIWQVREGQLDDLETPPRRILFDDVASEPRDPAPARERPSEPFGPQQGEGLDSRRTD